MFRDRDNYNAWMRQYTKRRRAAETPEQRAERNRKQRESYQRQKAKWTPEQVEKRRAAARLSTRKRYGIIDATDEAKVAPCEICGTVAALHMDHNKVSGKRRGWLCQQCNVGIGSLGHDVSRLAAASDYLRKYPE
jgi:hypothetical protein